MHTITDGIYYQDTYAGVVLGAVILPQGTLIIDSPFRPEQARSWKSSLLTQSRGTHRLMVNMDEHIDRTLGNRYIDLTILAHKKTADEIKTRSNIFKGQNFETGSEWEKYPDTIGARWAHPNLTFENQLNLYWGDCEILLEHRPGPAKGAIWVEIPSKKVMFLGDAVLVDQPPFLANADIPTWIENLSLLRTREYSNYTFISGRSGQITEDGVKAQMAMLKSIQGRLDTLAKRNSPPEGTEKMIPSILSRLDYAQKYEPYFTQRLQHGLHQYYLKHYSQDEVSPDE